MNPGAMFLRMRLVIVFALLATVWLCRSTHAGLPTLDSVDEMIGDYCQGDGLGVNCTLKLTKDDRFFFQWNGCLGVYGQNTGAAAVKEGKLILAPEQPNKADGFGGTPTEFYPVRWDSRIYLIADKEIIEFCNSVNQGTEPRTGSHGRWYLRREDWMKNAKGKPTIPKQWAKYLLAQPVQGKITRLAGKGQAWLNLGTKDGLFQGMELTALGHGDWMFASVRVEAVEESQCRIKCLFGGDELGVGQSVSSRFKTE